jgi:hypothetical protein
MRILRTLAFPLLAFACGAPASSAPPPTSRSTDEPAAETATDEANDANEAVDDSPPQCVAMGQPCESNAYCCYGSCRAEDGDPQLLCRP